MCGKLFPTVDHPHRIIFDGRKQLGNYPRSPDLVYLAQNISAAQEVESGLYKNGFEQWLAEGAGEGLS